ncbi:hypothetical protein GGR52DRAFT_531950, partial [Hypoxylon sp. FL1284]
MLCPPRPSPRRRMACDATRRGGETISGRQCSNEAEFASAAFLPFDRRPTLRWLRRVSMPDTFSPQPTYNFLPFFLFLILSFYQNFPLRLMLLFAFRHVRASGIGRDRLARFHHILFLSSTYPLMRVWGMAFVLIFFFFL